MQRYKHLMFIFKQIRIKNQFLESAMATEKWHMQDHYESNW